MADMYKIIDTLLKERGISGAKMSTDLGMSRSFMTELRKGRAKSIKAETAQRIADYFGVSVGYLLGNDEENSVLEKAKSELSEFVNSNPSALSGKRLDMLFSASGYDHVIVCFNLGIEQSYIDNWMNNNDLPPRPIIDKILGVFRLKPEDLLSGNELADYNSEALEWKREEKPAIPNHPQFSPLPKLKQWKVIGTAACGEPKHRELEEMIWAPDNINADLVFRCEGDSMTGVHIFDGDVVFVRSGAVENGQIAVVRIEDEYSLKRIYRGPDYLELRSENPSYSTIVIRGEQVNAEIVGRAVFVLTRVI